MRRVNEVGMCGAKISGEFVQGGPPDEPAGRRLEYAVFSIEFFDGSATSRRLRRKPPEGYDEAARGYGHPQHFSLFSGIYGSGAGQNDLAVETANSSALANPAADTSWGPSVGSTKMFTKSVSPINPKMPTSVLLCRS